MAEEEAIAEWSLKDALIVIPFLASALALAWEVGYFVRIGGGAFGLFSIVEHLTFALQALPIALIVTVPSVVGLAGVNLWKSLAIRGSRATRKIDNLNRYGVLDLLAVGAGLFAVWYLAGDLLLILILILGFVPYLLILNAPSWLLTHPLIVCAGVLTAFFGALTVGSVSARSSIQSSLPLNSIKAGEKGKDIETEIKVRILRTGERGVLYFDPATQTFGLLPWDYVRRIDWAISPFGTK
jgi:hypothetical protein